MLARIIKGIGLTPLTFREYENLKWNQRREKILTNEEEWALIETTLHNNSWHVRTQSEYVVTTSHLEAWKYVDFW